MLEWHCNEPLERVLTIEKFTQVKQRRKVWKYVPVKDVIIYFGLRIEENGSEFIRMALFSIFRFTNIDGKHLHLT